MNLRPLLPCVLLIAGLGPLHAEELKLHALLDGKQVVSATDSPATGEATAVLDDDGNLHLTLVYGGVVSNVTGASLHLGTSAENGQALMDLDVLTEQTVGSLVEEDLSLPDTAVERVRAGEAYILVTTIDHPEGDIRGQLVPQPVRLDDVPSAP